MSIKRITISVPEEVASRIKKAAGARPVSAWVTELVEAHLDDRELERAWAAFVAETAPTASGRAKANAAFQRLTKGSRRKGAA